MTVSYLLVSAVATAASIAGLQWWVVALVDEIRKDGLIEGDVINAENIWRALQLAIGSRVTVALLVNLAVNLYVLTLLCLKTLFFVQLNPPETRKLVERLVNYVISRGPFILLVVPPSRYHMTTWFAWLTVLCSLKMFSSLARDRLESLNASPSTTPSKYFRVLSALLLVLFVDLLWMKLCMTMHKSFGSNLYLLLLFEPLSIAFETIQAIMVHGFQLLDIWQRHSVENGVDILGLEVYNKIVAGSMSEWKGVIVRNCGFLLDMMALTMALGHYITIWWLHGVAFHVVDLFLFMNLQALLSAILKRIRGYLKLTKALSSLNGALPDATYDDICSFDDECAICRGPMARAKKLSCNHLFHLACLRSWLDQGLTEAYYCPTCRRPLFPPNARQSASTFTGEMSINNQVSDRDQETERGQLGTFSSQQQSISDPAWSGVRGLDSAWIPSWPNPGTNDVASTSGTIRSASLNGMQMMMRQLASVGDNYSRPQQEEASWNFWSSSRVSNIPHSAMRHGINDGVRFRSASHHSSNGNVSAMVDRVREVLPNIPDELIVQDLVRTNNINITVNNLLQLQ